MCKFKSMIVTSNLEVVASLETDSHDLLLESINVRETDENEPSTVKIEITPNNTAMTRNRDEWTFHIDENSKILPSWFIDNRDKIEDLCWQKWAEHISKQVYLQNEQGILRNNEKAFFFGNSSGKFYNNSSGEFYNNSSGVLYGNSSGVLYGNSSGKFYNNSSGEFYNNSSGMLYDNSSGKFYNNSSGKFYNNSSGKFYDNSSGSIQSTTATAIKNNKVYVHPQATVNLTGEIK